ncbi:hypothetical protein COL922a_010048 [Colletotrichum nupharicola]|nr:hypothetical protein COL922a_010048 [Colletotrichum nupharicola]
MRPTPTLLGLPRELRDEIIHHTIAADDLRESAKKFTKDYKDADDKHGWKWLALRSDLLQHATQSNNQPEHTYNFVLAMTEGRRLGARHSFLDDNGSKRLWGVPVTIMGKLGRSIGSVHVPPAE